MKIYYHKQCNCGGYLNDHKKLDHSVSCPVSSSSVSGFSSSPSSASSEISASCMPLTEEFIIMVLR